MDGEITIGTNLSTDKFDRQIAQLEKKMQKEEEKDIQISTKESGLEKIITDYEELRDEVNETSLTIEQFKRIRPAEAGIKTSDYLQSLSSLRQSYTELSSQLKEQTSQYMRARSELEKINTKHREINDKVNEYKQKIESVKIQKQVAEVDRMKESFKNVGSSIQSTVSKVSRLALGIFGLRSAYMALRRASSDLASYDQQYATNLEYIRYVLTQAIAPVLRWIVDLTARLLGYINAIMQAWFGINLFSRGSAESFNKMKAGASGASKAVKEIKKQLAGFDEINMLTDQSDTGTSAGAGGVGMPSFDLSAMQGEPPEWLKWIIDNKDLILSIMGGIAGALIAWKLGLSGIKALGIGTLISGIIYTIENLLKYLKEPTWENFGGIIQGVGTAVTGLGIALGSTATGAVGAGVLFYGTVIKYWDEIRRVMQSAIDWLREKSDWVKEHFGVVGGTIYEGILDTMQAVLNTFDIAINGIKKIFDGFITFFKGVFTANWTQAWEGIQQIFNANWEAIKSILGVFVEWTYKIVIQPIIDVFNWLWDGITNGAQNAWEGITGIFEEIGEWFNKNVINNIIDNFQYMGQRVGEVVSGAFKTVVNGILRTIESVLNAPIRAVNKLIGVINAVPRNKFRLFKYF